MDSPRNAPSPLQLPSSLQASCVRCGQQFSGASQLQSHALLCSNYEEPPDRGLIEEDEEEEEGEEEDEEELGIKEECPSSKKVMQISSGEFVMPPMDRNRASYYCEICRKTFTNYGSYRRHLRMHFCDKKYTCHLCGRQFFRRYLWVKHQEKIHGNDPSSCRCPHCGLWSKNADSLKEHLRTKHRRTNGKDPTNAASLPSPVNSPPPSESPSKSKKMKVAGIEAMSSPPPLQECFKCRECEAEFVTEAEVEEHCAVEHDADNLGPGTTSRYGRRRKQRVLFNTEFGTGRRRKRNSSGNASPSKISPGTSTTGNPKNGMDENTELSGGSPPPLSLGSPPPPPLGSPLPPELTPQDEEEDEDDKPLSLLSLEGDDIDDKTLLPGKFRKQRGQRGSFHCEKCNRMFINRSSYLRHQKMHTGIKPFSCEFCCTSFFRSESLASHKKKHIDPADFRCYVCGFRAANAAALRTHFYTVCERVKDSPNFVPHMDDEFEHDCVSTSGPPKLHNEKTSTKLAPERDIAGFCSLCNRAFFNPKNFDKHMRLHNLGAPSYSCTVCNKVFYDEQQYQDHLQTHNGNKHLSSLELLKSFGATQGDKQEIAPPSPQGPSCIKEESIDLTRDSSDSNARNESANTPSLFCKFCPLSFVERDSYIKHVKSHEKASIGFCSYCGNPFTCKKELAIHERICYMTCCRDDKMYSCYGCSIYFDGTENLIQHVRSAHLDADDLGLPSFSDLEKELASEYRTVQQESTSKCKTEPAESSEIKIKCRTLDKSLMTPKLESRLQSQEVQVTIVEATSKSNTKGDKFQTNKLQQRYKCGRCNETFGDLKTIFSHFHQAHGVAQVNNGLEVEKVAKELKAVAASHMTQDRMEPEPPLSIMKQLLSTPPAPPPVNKPMLNCGLCFKSFKEKSALNHHEQLSHVMVDWYKCDVCSKSGSHETMKSHMLSHMHKVGSVVTAVGADLPDIDSPDDNNNNNNNNNERDDDDFGGPDDARDDEEGSGTRSPGDRSQNPLEVISVLCQLCKKIFSSSSALKKHRHTGFNLSVTHPFICCMPNCGQCFTLREDILAHLKTQHTNSTWNINRIRNSGPSWSDDLSSGPGPFSQSLLQLSLQTLADNEAKRSSSSSSLLDIYETTEGAKSHSAGGGSGCDVEEITVEPLLEGLQEPVAPATVSLPVEDEEFREDDMSPTPPSSPSAQDAPSYLDDRTKVLLKCDDCDSVFTNPCSWKRHRKLHLGIMKHKCPHCSRMFYRKDHCDKHVKTHSRVIKPRPSLEK